MEPTGELEEKSPRGRAISKHEFTLLQGSQVVLRRIANDNNEAMSVQHS